MRLPMIVALLGASLSFGAVNGAVAGCDASGGLEFVCGIANGEDLVRVPNTPWLIVSGFAADAGISLIDSRNGSHAKLYPDERSRVRHDARFADCTTPPSTATWVTHGLHLRPGSDGHSTLYVVGHGSREAIEVFDVDANASGAGTTPSMTWTGCVPMPDGFAANSVAAFADGSLVATVLLMPGMAFGELFSGKPTGVVLEWSPGKRGFEQIKGSDLPGNNGIEVSEDGREIFVASTGLRTVVAFAHTNPTKQLRTTETLSFMPDNVHRGIDGKLLTAGMKTDEPACGGQPGAGQGFEQFAACPRGFVAMAIDPVTMRGTLLSSGPANPAFSNATMVLLVDKRYWIGTFSGDRVGYGTLR